MNFRQKITLPLLLYIATYSTAFPQVVEIPDPNLRRAVSEALNLPAGAPITQEDMNRLTHLDMRERGIGILTGLEFATNLNYLLIAGNPTIDLSPIATLKQLEHLHVWAIPRLDITLLSNLTNLRGLTIAACDIVDISPLAQLTQLTGLNLSHNRIINIAPLARLTHLVELGLNDNRIADVTALAGLTSLEFLEIQANSIFDHSPLDALALSHFIYDQSCEMQPLPLEPRLENRHYPSIAARWSGFGWPPVSNRPDLSEAENMTLHDLQISVNVFGLRFLEKSRKPYIFTGLNEFTMYGDVDRALRLRDEFLFLNPNMVLLVHMDLRTAPFDSFPEDWPYWIRDEHGDIFIEWHQGKPKTRGHLDFTHPTVQDMIVEQVIAVSKCGLYDGIIFDYWSESRSVLGGWDGTSHRFFRPLEVELQAREIIVQRIRAETHPNFLIMGNTDDSIIPRTGPYINGGFMETTIPAVSATVDVESTLTKVENSLLWLDQNLRQPRINTLEGYALPSEPPDSPTNLRWMRALTALSLTHSDGYVLFTEYYTWTHHWYDFWDADLGRPVEEKAQLYEDGIPGLYIREFTNGWAVYNHSGEAQVITLPEEAQGVASGLVNTEHALPNLDGEMYLWVKPKNPADVNGDGVVNILDLVVVAQGFGTDKKGVDVNGDGVVNVFDLVQVAGVIGDGDAAPSASSPELSIISATDVETWLAGAQGLGVGDANLQRGIRFLEQLLAALAPKETTLLPNYPNPFNPETWIPYRLAQEAEVAIMIYDTKGTQVRRLALGNQAAGYYAERGKAAYWDGRNEDGEVVASGIYIYQFRAGDYAASRRMVIVK